MKLIENLKKLQELIRDTGLGLSTLALPAPKLLLLPSYSDSDVAEEILFDKIVTEPEISDVSKDLFQSGFYNQAVTEAYKALNKFIQKRSGKKLSDTSLMNLVFSEKDPMLFWSDRKSISEIDEQRGYMFLMAGSFTGIRNPCAHEIDWIDDHETALDAILIAQHLLRKARTAQIKTPASS